LLVQANQHRDRRRTRLFGPIIAMTFGGLAMLVALSVFLIQRFDSEASKRETVMVEHGFARQLDELDAVVAPQVNWDDAILNLDHRLNAEWAEFNIGNYLYTFNGFNRAFVVDGEGRPIYASVDGKQAEIGHFAPFAPVVAQLLPVIRQAETARPALGKRPGKHNILVPPIEANVVARVDGQAYVVIASLVQPDFGESLPKGPHSPVAIVAKPIDAAMLGAFSQRYLLENLQLVEPGKVDAGSSRMWLRNRNGQAVAALTWTPRQPGTLLFQKLAVPLLLALLGLGVVAWVIVRRGAGVANELFASEARTKHLAYHDMLTGLPNRAKLFERLDPMLAQIGAASQGITILCVDLDRFKEVNDTLGHHAGDLLIEEVARRLRSVCDEEALVARLGGDEFVVLLARSDRPEIERLAEQVLEAIRMPVTSQYGQFEVSGSIGVAIVERPGIDSSEALRWADLALYCSKDLGRARVTFFEPEMDAEQRSRRSLEADLRAALGDGSLHLVYQPQVDRAGNIAAVEALLRWTHPVRGVIPPSVFVPLAEASGLILGLGELVLRQALAETRNWRDVRVAINVSSVQMRAPGFSALVTRLAARAGIDPTRYEIELTETALLGDDPVTAGNIEALKRLGFSLALDDFGTGYSSMSVLQRFAVDKIKIDRSFVSCLGGANEAEALVDAMVKLARALNLSVIAEGVETEEQMARLIACGCHEFQGHLTGMPMPAAQLEQLIGAAPALEKRAVNQRG
jgi:diguanylate cyclase (GGDEF)-like protein